MQIEIKDPLGPEKSQGSDIGEVGKKAENLKIVRKRRLINLFLEPGVQIRIGLLSNMLALLFAGTLVLIFYIKMKEYFLFVLDLTELEEEVRKLGWVYFLRTLIWFVGLTAIYLITNIFISVLYTHRLVGPAYALRKHIRSLINGQYHARTYLRKGDNMQDVANELNKLSDILEKKLARDSKKVS